MSALVSMHASFLALSVSFLFLEASLVKPFREREVGAERLEKYGVFGVLQWIGFRLYAVW